MKSQTVCGGHVTAAGLRARAVFFGLLLLVTRTGWSADSPMAVVQQTTDAVLAVLDDHSLSSADKRRKIEDIVYERFDFETLSRLVLARNWKQLAPEQQRQFVDEFKRHLSLTYGKNVENYNNERAVIIGDRAEAHDDWTVKTRIVRPAAEDVLVDYRLRKQGEQWRVIDVLVEGVSLVANFRSQFQDIITKDGAAKLIDLLREKNAKGEPLKS
ncbi:MAG: ABC transporter substrate-binding protein [Deltaproteobacteria bacterium]|nr:ABC transporter substrate-binding protein [Deltaproteobacteria bacterium]